MTVASSGGSSGTTLYALSQATGATVWSRPISGTYHLSNAAYDSGQVFVVNFDGLLRAFDADTGTLNWSVQLNVALTISAVGIEALIQASDKIVWAATAGRTVIAPLIASGSRPATESEIQAISAAGPGH